MENVLNKRTLLPVNIKQFDDSINLEAIKKFLEENKDSEDVKGYLDELSAVSAEKVEGFLDTPEGKKLLQPRLDSNFTKGLTTWKENNLEKLVDEEVKKRYPDETPEQKELAKLRKEIEDERKARLRESLVNKALKVADEKQLPKGIIDFFIAEDEEKTNENLSKLEEEYQKAIKTAVDAKFKENGTNFNQGGGGNPQPIDISDLANKANIRNQ